MFCWRTNIYFRLVCFSLTLIAASCSEPPTAQLELEVPDYDLFFRAKTGQREQRIVTIHNRSSASTQLKLESEDGSVKAIGGSCLKGVAPKSSCFFQLEFYPTTDLDDKESVSYKDVPIRVNGGALQFTVGVRQYGSERFISVPQNLPGYRSIASNRIKSVFVDPNGTIYAGTANGLSISKDGGNQWVTFTAADGLSDNYIRSVFVSEGVIYAATGDLLSISKDRGGTWSHLSTKSDSVFVDKGIIYSGIRDGLEISRDGGNSWSLCPTQGMKGTWAEGVLVVDTTFYVATHQGLSISNDDCLSWTTKTTADGLNDNYLYGIWMYDGVLYASTDVGIMTSPDGGTSWLDSQLEGKAIFIEKDRIYLGTKSGLNVSQDGGQTWVNKSTKHSAIFEPDRLFLSDHQIYAIGHQTLKVSKDSGANWTDVPIKKDARFNFTNDIFVSKNNFHLATDKGLFLSPDRGSNWTDLDSPGARRAVSCVSIDGNAMYKGDNNSLQKSTDGGNSWTSILNSSIVRSIFADQNKIYAATLGGLHGSQDGGQNWQKQLDKGTEGLFARGSEIYAATESNGLFISLDDGNNWIQKTSAQGLPSKNLRGVVVDGDRIYVATNFGLAMR